jgi:hypothetical protein
MECAELLRSRLIGQTEHTYRMEILNVLFVEIDPLEDFGEPKYELDACRTFFVAASSAR